MPRSWVCRKKYAEMPSLSSNDAINAEMFSQSSSDTISQSLKKFSLLPYIFKRFTLTTKPSISSCISFSRAVLNSIMAIFYWEHKQPPTFSNVTLFIWYCLSATCASNKLSKDPFLIFVHRWYPLHMCGCAEKDWITACHRWNGILKVWNERVLLPTCHIFKMIFYVIPHDLYSTPRARALSANARENQLDFLELLQSIIVLRVTALHASRNWLSIHF